MDKNGRGGYSAISIHALCEEGDMHSMPPICGPSNFYPRPLRGGRRGGRADQFRGVQISIHALCEEGDRRCRSRVPGGRNFYPRPLRGGRPAYTSPQLAAINISIHALCEEGDADA